MHGDLPQYISLTKGGRYSVRVPRINSKGRIRLGTYPTLEEALRVRNEYLKIEVLQGMPILEQYAHEKLHPYLRTVKIPLSFRRRAVGLVFFSDLHFGSDGTFYQNIKEDTECVMRNPDMRIVMYGDIIDNFVVGRLQALQRTQGMPHREELRLGREWLQYTKPKMDLLVAGNHDLWTESVSGVSLYEYLLQEDADDFPFYYHPYEIVADIETPVKTYNMVVRHKWRGTSRKNPTIGIENSWEERPIPFDIGVMGHFHVASLYRQFIKQHQVRHAIITGTYKLIDDYPVELGLAASVGVGSGVLIFFDDRPDPIWCASVQTADKLLRAVNGGSYA